VRTVTIISVSQQVDNSYLDERLYILQKQSGLWGWFLHCFYELQCLITNLNLSVLFYVFILLALGAYYVNIANL